MDSESTEGMGSGLEWPSNLSFLPHCPWQESKKQKSEPYSGPFHPTPYKSVRVLKPALFRLLLSTEHTREEAKASETLAYEKYNKGDWVQQLGSYAEAAGTGLSGHSGLSPPRARWQVTARIGAAGLS